MLDSFFRDPTKLPEVPPANEPGWGAGFPLSILFGLVGLMGLVGAVVLAILGGGPFAVALVFIALCAIGLAHLVMPK